MSNDKISLLDDAMLEIIALRKENAALKAKVEKFTFINSRVMSCRKHTVGSPCKIGFKKCHCGDNPCTVSART